VAEAGVSPIRVYAALIENSNDCICVHAADGRTVYQSPAVTNQLGYLPDELIGRHPFDLFHPDDRPALEQRFYAVLANDASLPPLRLRCRHKDGSWRVLEFTTSRFVNEPHEPFVVLNARDVTAITEASAALQASEHRLDLALELGAMGVTEFDYRTGELTLSTSLTRLMGYETAPAAAGLSWFLQHVLAEDRGALAAVFNAIKTPASDEFESLFRLVRGGQQRWWFGRVRVIRDAAGDPVRAVGLVSDITERRQLEEQVRQVQKLDAIGQLAGGVAHDFNNLLTVITGYAETLLRSMPPTDARFADVREIQRAADRAALLTQQLLAFSRKQVLRPDVVDVNGVVRDIAMMVGRLIGCGIDLRLKLAERPATVLVDRTQLEQVLINLSVNARDAMPDGGVVELRTRVLEVTDEDAVRLFPVKPGSYVRLSVSDTGVGMTPDVKARAFEPFFTTKEPGKGTGIGLSTVYGIVQQSGGFVLLGSEPGRGTTFDVYLPLSLMPRKRAPSATTLTPEIPTLTRATVLVVEDYGRLRELAKKILKRRGYHVLTADSGRAALEIARTCDGTIDVLLTDVVMPGMSGPELARHVHTLRPEAAVVFMSGYAGDVLDRHGVNPGEVFLEKPFTPAALSKKVHEALAAKSRHA
jgi:PAS domain S-box-containing protein